MPSHSVSSSRSGVDPEMVETVEENGRTFVRTTKYSLPNDSQEQDRLDLQHLMFTQLFNDKLHLAPIDDKPLKNVLDLATGTGIWAMEFAKEYPRATVTGNDLVTVSEQGKPANCRFIVEDAEDNWDYLEPWDYIHGRALLSCFSDPKTIIQKAFDSLIPGGYLELQDPVMPMEFAKTPPKDSPFVLWNELSLKAAQKGGRPWDNVVHYAQWMRDIGFVDVEEHKFVIHTGTWSQDPREKRLGSWQLLNMMNALEGFTIRNLKRLGWSLEDCQKLVSDCKDELESGVLEPFNDVLVVYGRKPM